MLERRERAQPLGHVALVHAQRERGCRHGQRVRGVVLAFDLQFFDARRSVLRTVQRHAQRAVGVQERGVVAAARGAHVTG